eukprot:2783367-Amphidinium_carterae.1
MLSGRYAYVVVPSWADPELPGFQLDDVLQRCCEKLALDRTRARYSLVHGDDFVPAEAEV